MTNRKIPQTDRWAIGNCSLRCLWSNNAGWWVEDEKDATIFDTSLAASAKMHELELITDAEMEVLDLDPSQTYHILLAFNEY